MKEPSKDRIKAARRRKNFVWEDSRKAKSPIGMLFYELSLCEYAPDPIEAFNCKTKEILLMLQDSEALNRNASSFKETED